MSEQDKAPKEKVSEKPKPKKKDQKVEKASPKKEEIEGKDEIEEELVEEVGAEVKEEPVVLPPKFGDRDPRRTGRDGRRPQRFEEEAVEWVPRTKLGKQVHSGMITSMHEIMQMSTPIKEYEIVDKLITNMEEEVLDVGRVQRVTDSGRRMRFRIVTAIGNRDGFIGVGISKGKEAGPTIRKSIARAKLEIVEIKRGCGSWECTCGTPHTVPYEVSGKVGSVKVTLRPAPMGVGIVSGKIAKTILSLAGITDVWVKTEGHTRTGLNFAKAVIKALENTNYMKIKDSDIETCHIVTGASKIAGDEPEEKNE